MEDNVLLSIPVGSEKDSMLDLNFELEVAKFFFSADNLHTNGHQS
jgi:hypothetical protein